MCIYLVEDDENIRELVVYTLTANGYKAVGFDNAEKFWHAMENRVPNLILLDIMLPGEDGLSILTTLRNNENTLAIPIIMLTAKSNEYDKVLGLDLGADDYLTKPFGMMELLSRIKAVTRRIKGKVEPVNEQLAIENIRINLKTFTAYCENEEISLTLKEFELLKYLLQNKNIVITRSQLLEQIWGYNFEGETRTVDVHIGSLRQKLGESGKIIETIRGVGYKIKE